VQQPNRNEFLGNGFRPQAFYGLKNYPGVHYYTNYIFLSPQQSDTLYYSKMQTDDQAYNELIMLLELCKSKGIDVHLFINPAHASLDGEGIRAVGKWTMFENWKRRLTSISASYAVDLWDFSGYNSITTERVSTPMNYYWDSSHYTELVGGYMMSRMFEPHNYKGPRDFGFQLTSKNIEGHLKSIRDDRERYAQANRSYIDSLNYDYKAIIDGAPLDQIRVKDMY
jgi:hypothetical protein